MSQDHDDILEFGDYQIDVRQKLLLRSGDMLPLAPKLFETLLVLVTSQGKLVEKDELLKTVWPGTFVEEGSLARNVSTLRKVLGDDRGEPRYIETIPKRGYRFVAPVRSPRRTDPATPLEIGPGPLGGEMLPLSQARRRSWLEIGIRGASAAVFILMGLALSQVTGGVARVPTDSIRSIAVLPLRNLSANPDDEFFADGTTESLISSLAQLHVVAVTSRTSVMRYKSTTKPLSDIARELNVDAVVEGSVQRADGRIRITAQLIRTSTDTHMWASEYDRDARDFLQLQSDIAHAIVHDIRPAIATDGKVSPPTEKAIDPAAREAYMLGRFHYWRNGESDLRSAIEYFNRATQIEPKYAEAYAGASLAWSSLANFRDSRAEPEGRSAALRAIAISPNLAEAYSALGQVFLNTWEWAEADRAYRKALELDPDQLDACGCYSIFLARRGRTSEALAMIEHGRRLDPLSTTIEWQYGVILYFAQRHDEAAVHLRRAIELDPRNTPAYRTLVRNYEEAGQLAEAMTWLDRPQFRESYELGIAYVMQGRRDEARQILHRLEAAQRRDAWGIATLWFYLGDRDRGFDWLAKAIDDKHPLAPTMKVAPLFANLRSDPRFVALLHRLNLPD